MQLYERVKEIFKMVDIDVYSTNIQMIAFDVVGIFGVKKILFIDEEEIVLLVKEGNVKISGNGLLLKKAAEGEVYIRGDIYEISKEK